eukprot:g39248.t1
MIPGMKDLSYEKWLRTLGAYLMEFRKMRGDLIETYRILRDLDKVDLEKMKKGGGHAPIYINSVEVERVKSIKFLGVTIINKLSWTSHADVTVKKAQQRLFFLRQLWKFGMSIAILTNFYSYSIESKVSGCITACYGNCAAQDRKKLQEVVCTAQTIMEANLPSTDSIYTSCCHINTANIIKDPSYPDNTLFWTNQPNLHIPGHYGQFSTANPSNLHIFGLLEETGAPGGNPRRHGENVQTP